MLWHGVKNQQTTTEPGIILTMAMHSIFPVSCNVLVYGDACIGAKVRIMMIPI